MGIYDQLGLDKKVDLNSFSADDAAKVFEEAAAKLRNSKATKETIQTLTAAGFTVLKILSMFVK
jgi:hypothetical protein